MPEANGADGGNPPRRAHHDHPAAGQLEGFMHCELDAAARRVIVRHLLTGCEQCIEVTRRIFSLGSEKPLAALYPGELPEADEGEETDSDQAE